MDNNKTIKIWVWVNTNHNNNTQQRLFDEYKKEQIKNNYTFKKLIYF